MNMTRRSLGSISSFAHTRWLAGLLVVAAIIAAAGCEQALQVAPTSSVLVLSAAVNNVPLNGILPLTATVTDPTGKPVAEGTLVSFSSTLGVLDPIEARVSNGRASTRLLAGSISGLATVRAASGGIISTALDIRVGPVPARIVIASSITVNNGANLVATVFDSNGVAVVGAPVTFTTTAGTLSSVLATTDALGQAFTTLFGIGDSVVTAESVGIKTSLAVRFGSIGGSLTVNIGMSNTTPIRHQTIVFTANVTGLGGLTVPIQRYEWDFGGGVVVTSTGNTTSRTYDFEGTYGLTLRVYGIDGSVGLSSIQFYVD